mgnify:CR=1 FL=1
MFRCTSSYSSIMLSLSTVVRELLFQQRPTLGSSICTNVPLLLVFQSFTFKGFLPLLLTTILIFIDPQPCASPQRVRFDFVRRSIDCTELADVALVASGRIEYSETPIRHVDRNLPHNRTPSRTAVQTKNLNNLDNRFSSAHSPCLEPVSQ